MAKDQDKLDVLTGIIDQNSKTYSFNRTMTLGGKKQTGTFVAKYLGITARLRLGVIRAKLLDGAPNQSVDTLTDDLAYMIAYLNVALIKFPPWGNYDNLDSIEELRDLYLEVYNFMTKFREQNETSTNVGSSTTPAVETNMESMQRTAIGTN